MLLAAMIDVSLILKTEAHSIYDLKRADEKQLLCFLARTGQGLDLITGYDQYVDAVAAEQAGPAGDECFHIFLPVLVCVYETL